MGYYGFVPYMMAVTVARKPLIQATSMPVLRDNNPLCVCFAPISDHDGCDDDDFDDGDNAEDDVPG